MELCKLKKSVYKAEGSLMKECQILFSLHYLIFAIMHQKVQKMPMYMGDRYKIENVWGAKNRKSFPK